MNETNGTGNWAGVRKRAGNLRVPPALMRLGAQQLGRRVLDPGLTWEVQRRRLDQLTRGAVVPRGTTVTESTMNGVRAEVVTVGGARPERTVVHFHGGGYCVGSARTARAWAAHLSARAGCRVVLPEYRLAPEHPYPAALEDARAVMKALLRDVTPASVVVSGDSAGGVDVTYTRWPRMWHDFALQPGLLAAADSALAQAAWFVQTVTGA